MNSTAGFSATLWSIGAAPTITVVPPLRVAMRQASIERAGADGIERVVDADPVR